jgi:hypothetical protein
MICDKYSEQTALYVPLLLYSAFSQLSDFNHFTPMTERGSSYEEKCLTEDEISAELLADTLSDVPDSLIVTVKMTVTLLLLEIDITKLCILYRALLGSLVSIS